MLLFSHRFYSFIIKTHISKVKLEKKSSSFQGSFKVKVVYNRVRAECRRARTSETRMTASQTQKLLNKTCKKTLHKNTASFFELLLTICNREREREKSANLQHPLLKGLRFFFKSKIEKFDLKFSSIFLLLDLKVEKKILKG